MAHEGTPQERTPNDGAEAWAVSPSDLGNQDATAPVPEASTTGSGVSETMGNDDAGEVSEDMLPEVPEDMRVPDDERWVADVDRLRAMPTTDRVEPGLSARELRASRQLQGEAAARSAQARLGSEDVGQAVPEAGDWDDNVNAASLGESQLRSAQRRAGERGGIGSTNPVQGMPAPETPQPPQEVKPNAQNPDMITEVPR